MKRLAFDLEADGLFPTRIWCITARDPDTGLVYEWHTTTEDVGFAHAAAHTWCEEVLDDADVVFGHNIINFDLPVLKRLLGWTPSKGVTDTLVLSRLSQPDREGGHSLRAWGERLGFEKGDHDDWSQFSSEMLKYCHRDTEVTCLLLNTLEQEMEGWDQRAITLEHKIAEIITEQEINGFYFDVASAARILGDIRHRIGDIDAACGFPNLHNVKQGTEVALPYKMDGQLKKPVVDYYADLSDDPTWHGVVGPFCKISFEWFNPDSTHHMKKWLQEQGWKPDKTTPTGAPQLTESSLLAMGPLGEKIVERGILNHRARQIEGLLERVREDGRIAAGANPCGTPTGRMRHSNVVNIPKADPSVVLGKEIRSLFCVPRGRVLVGYDAKGLELRILAHYIGNLEYVDVIVNGDPHVFAQRAAGLPDRQSGKTFNYAFIYGAGLGKLGALVGGGYAEGRRVAERMYAAVPGLGNLVERVRRAAQRGYLIGLDGRRLYLREEHKALNTLIQAGGAVAMKWIAVLLDGWVDKSRAMKVCDMHDEAQWEVDPDYVETFRELVHAAFVEATHQLGLNCPLEADVKVGKNWAETH